MGAITYFPFLQLYVRWVHTDCLHCWLEVHLFEACLTSVLRLGLVRQFASCAPVTNLLAAGSWGTTTRAWSWPLATSWLGPSMSR